MTNQTANPNIEWRAAPGHRRGFVIAISSLTCLPARQVRHSGFALRVWRDGAVFLAAAAVLCATSGCAGWSSQQTRRDIYLNLMTPVQQAHYRSMETAATPLSLRLAYLQEIGVYQQWAEQPKDIQQAILRRQVGEGMKPLQVQMAWGTPDDRRDETEPAERSDGHAKIVWEYGPRTAKVGGISHGRSVCFFDDRVLWVRRPR